MAYSEEQTAVSRAETVSGHVVGGKKASSPEQLAAVMEARQTRLAADIDEFMGRIHPTAVAVRTTRAANRKARELFWTEQGDLRTERVAAAGIGFAAVVALLFRIVRRKR